MTDRIPGRIRRALPSLCFALGLLLAAVVLRHPLVLWFTGKNLGGSPGQAVTVPGRSAAGEGAGGAPVSDSGHDPNAIDHYTCSMHPSVKQQAPGKCPICGMDLIPVTNAQQEQGTVLIDEARRQLIGVRTGEVIDAPMQSTLRAVGRVAYDESRLSEVSLRVRGWIKRLFVSETGQQVRAGEPLLLLYSPELYNAEQDFLLAAHGQQASAGAAHGLAGAPGAGRGETLARAARRRLELLGLTRTQIDQLDSAGVPSDAIPILAPVSGFVIEKAVVEGASVDAGMRLYRIAALDRVWIEAEVYEADLPRVRAGQQATVTLDYLPGKSYAARISYVYPYLDAMARVGKVRVELANEKLELRPGMYASVSFLSDATARLQVPISAVVYTGPRRLVFVDQGAGRFSPREIRIGREANGNYEVLEGLSAGEHVATSGVFLIAAEARISSAAKYWDKEPEAMGAQAPPPGNASGAAEQSIYSCPMHPEVQSTVPGNCPKCGMKLAPQPRRGEP
jgi:Cu(I)/Ag(I) efflux system membrane fusion protein